MSVHLHPHLLPPHLHPLLEDLANPQAPNSSLVSAVLMVTAHLAVVDSPAESALVPSLLRNAMEDAVSATPSQTPTPPRESLHDMCSSVKHKM